MDTVVLGHSGFLDRKGPCLEKRAGQVMCRLHPYGVAPALDGPGHWLQPPTGAPTGAVAPTGAGAGRGGRGGNRKASIQITDNTGSEV